MFTQEVTMKSMAQRMGPSRFHKPFRSSCIDMAISKAPSKNRVYTNRTKEGRKDQVRTLKLSLQNTVGLTSGLSHI